MAEGAVDVIIFQSLVECSHEGGVEDGDGQGEGDDEYAADCAHDRCGEAAQSAEEGEKADEDFHRGGNDSHNVGYQHPFGDRLVDLQTVPKLFAEQLVRFGPGESPYFHGVEPEG